jgi:polysaccharide biosynthesis transport protein
MNLKGYLIPLLRWWWLLVAAPIVAGGATFLATMDQQPMYQSRATLMIGQSISSPNPTSVQFHLEQQLAAIYADMGTREPVRKDTMDALGLNWLPQFVVRTPPNTQLVEITVTDTDPVRAQAVAAELANQLIQRTPTNLRPQDNERQSFINEQLNLLQENIVATQDEIEQLKFQIAEMNSAQQISETQRQITSLESKLTNMQSNYSSLLASTEKGALNTLSIVEPPEVPGRPIGPNKLSAILLAGMIGLSLAAGGAYAIEYLDQTIRSRKEAERLLGFPLIAEVPGLPKNTDMHNQVANDPYSSFADSFRSMRTHLGLEGLGTSLKTIIVTSAGASDGKTVVATNLMLSIAEANKRVVLVDADLYKSELEEKFGHSEQKMNGLIPVQQISPNAHMVFLRRIMFDGKQNSGKLPKNPSEIFNSGRISEILNRLRETVDVVIIDSPPFILSDALVLSLKADGVLVVVNQNHTRRDMLQRMKEQIKRANVKVLGFVMNGVARKESMYYGYYYQYVTPPQKKRANPLASFFQKINPRESKELEEEHPTHDLTVKTGD